MTVLAEAVHAACPDGVTYHHVPQRSPGWHELRAGIVTSSEFKRIVTPAAWKLASAAGRAAYIGELLAARLGFTMPDVDTPWMAHGRDTESQARDAFCFVTDHDALSCGMFTSDRFGATVGASPDSLLDLAGELVPHELKCPSPHVHVKYLVGAPEVPRDYLPQVHGHMAVLGADRAFFQSFAPGLPDLIIEVRRDDRTRQLEEYLRRFCDELATAEAHVSAQEQTPRVLRAPLEKSE